MCTYHRKQLLGFDFEDTGGITESNVQSKALNLVNILKVS